MGADMTDLVVETGVPLPPRSIKPAAFSVYFYGILGKLELGDSVFAPKSQEAIWTYLSRYSRETGYKFTTRKTPDGVRVWRVK